MGLGFYRYSWRAPEMTRGLRPRPRARTSSVIVGVPLKGPDGIERPGIEVGAAFHGDPDQAPRGAKEWLTEHMPRRVSYKPTTDQLAMTRLLDLEGQRLNELSSFRRLRRSLRFLAENQTVPGSVYPQKRWQ